MADTTSLMLAPTYSASAAEAAGHGKSMIQSTLGQHPVATGVVIGVLVLLILVLGFVIMHYRGKAAKDGFYEGMAAEPVYVYPDYNMDSSVGLPATCKAPWSADAMSEAQALATVGSFQHDSDGERQLQDAINAAYDVGN